LRIAVARDLTARHGLGHWSTQVSESGVRRGITHSHVCIARADDAVVGTLRLGTTKPWAIDISYFTPCARAVYLTDMAVHPSRQGRGVGRLMLQEARRIAAEWPAAAIRHATSVAASYTVARTMRMLDSNGALGVACDAESGILHRRRPVPCARQRP
jgi:GNAT superfamily N-acetyltransferase